MKFITRRFKYVLTTVILTVYIALILTGCSMDTVTNFINNKPTVEEMLERVPKMDQSKFNRFRFSMDIMAGNAKGDGKEFNMSGTLETYNTISHLYNLDVNFEKSGYKTKAESFTDFSKNEVCKNLGDGWITGHMRNENAIEDLVAAINNRDTEMILTIDDSVCALSWTFPTDNNYLFGDILDDYIIDDNLEGYGRITAIFDPETYQFQYFTFVISASNQERAGALLDAIFYWEVINSEDNSLEIPEDISKSAYQASTGVSSDGGYDDIVNPLAENFIKSYGGTAEVTHNINGAHMFWTLEEDDKSVTINYAKENDSANLFDESYNFFTSVCDSYAEDSDNGVYFYKSDTGELIYIAKGEYWYSEIIITGKPGITQGELMKSLITYKSKLNI